MTSIAVLVPVLDRPQNVAPLMDSLNLSVAHERAIGWDVWPLFLLSPGDAAEREAINALGATDALGGVWGDTGWAEMPWPHGAGDYAKKINFGATCPQYSDVDWFFTGADDLRFHPGWLRAAIDRHIETGALVIGTNDLHNPSVTRGHYATHLLVHSDYVKRGTIDEPGKIMHEGYSHNCPDTELVETAKVRQTFAFARDSHVEHLHPIFRGAPDDATYRKGREHHAEDKLLLRERRKLWTRTGAERRRLRLVAPRR